MSILNYAIAYAKKGISVIPANPKTKVPCLVSWKEYQSKVATEDEIREWWGRWPDANVGIVTGAISGIVVVDVDTNDISATQGLELPPTPTVKTAKGWHYYYRYPGQKVENSVRIREHIDIRADGGYVVAPPSIHATGHTYEWVLTDVDFAPLPKWATKEQRVDKDWREKLNGSGQGNRNQTAAEIAGKLLHSFKKEDWGLAWDNLVLWNQRNVPPLEEKELLTTFESIKGREISRRATSTGGMNLNDIADNTGEYRIISTEELKEKVKNEKQPPLVPMKCGAFDHLLGGGLAAGEMVSIAGWPGNGKTEFCTFLTKNMEPKTALWFEYECSERDLLTRYSFAPPIFYVPCKYKNRDIFWLITMIKKAKINFPSIRFVFIDAIQSAMNITQTMRPDLQIGAMMTQLRELSNELNEGESAFNLILINRVTKPMPNEQKREMEMGDVPGSADIEHEVDFSIYVQRVPNDYNPWSAVRQNFHWDEDKRDDNGNYIGADNHTIVKIAKRRPQRAKAGRALLELVNGEYKETRPVKKETAKVSEVRKLSQQIVDDDDEINIKKIPL